MTDDSLSNIQPDTASAEPVASVVPAEPETPIVPEAPAVPAEPVKEDNKLTEEDKTEADEWDKAADELFPGLKKSEEDKKEDEPAKPKETDEKVEADKKTEEDSKLKEDTSKSTEEDDAKQTEEDEQVEPTDASARLTAREQQAEVDAVKSDVREKMFSATPTELRDADGDLIKSIDDVMKLNNPRTGQPFTEEEAGMWLIQAQNTLKENTALVERQVNEIADTNIDLKDQADVVNYQYGELLRAMPELRASLWAQYEKTLAKDTKSGIITKAPVSLQKFYETALEPYAELGRNLESQETIKTEETAKADAKIKAEAEAKKTQVRQDRSDIYGKGKVDTQTDDDKEWSAAAEAVFGKLT